MANKAEQREMKTEEKRETNRKIQEKLKGETFRYYCPICEQWFNDFNNQQARIHREMCLNKKGGN